MVRMSVIIVTILPQIVETRKTSGRPLRCNEVDHTTRTPGRDLRRVPYKLSPLQRLLHEDSMIFLKKVPLQKE